MRTACVIPNLGPRSGDEQDAMRGPAAAWRGVRFQICIILTIGACVIALLWLIMIDVIHTERRAAIERVGLFHPEYFAYYEDTDLAMRLTLFGLRCRYLNDAVGYHLGSATGKQYSDFHRYHLRRNVELLYWVNMVGSLVWRHLASHLAYELFAFTGMLVRGQGGVFLRAKRDAFKLIPWIRRQRKLLREQLRNTVGIPGAKRMLQARIKPFAHAFFRGENIRKF